MSGPGREALHRGLYSAADFGRATETIRRINLCHERRLNQLGLGLAGGSVAAAQLVLDLVEAATPAELRAMVTQLTTPELRPAVPVVLGPTSAPAPPAPVPWVDRVLGLVQLYGNACHEISGRYFDRAPNVRQLLGEIREALNDGSLSAMVAELEKSYRESPGFRDKS